MTQLSKAAKRRIEEAVMLGATRLYEDPRPLRVLHLSRPEKFASVLLSYILNHWDMRQGLWQRDLALREHREGVKLIESSIRRMRRRGDLRKAALRVPVLLGRNGGKQHLEDRMMTCYWPATVLDRLANC
jgi:hypothetical protein